MASVRHDRLSAHDATFLYAETSTVSMNVGGIFVLAPGPTPLTVDHLEQLIDSRVHLVPRLRQRLLTVPLNAGFPVWVDDPAFDLDNHVRPVPLPGHATWHDVLDLMARLQAERLDRDRPLWDMFLTEQLSDGTTVLLLRAHHALVDGMSGIRLLQTLFGKPAATMKRPWDPPTLPSRAALLTSALTQKRQRAARVSVRRNSAPFRRMPLPRRGPFNVTVGRQRTLVTFTLPSADARDIAKQLDGTVQDVALTIVAGAVGRMLRSGNLKRRKRRALRTVIPVAEAVPARHLQLGNHAAFTIVDLPIRAMPETDRFARIHKATNKAKEAGQAEAIANFIKAGERVPAALYAVGVPLLSRTSSANLLVTFMRGPRRSLDIAGAQVLAAYPSLPLGRRMALLVGILDLGGAMGFAFTADPRAVPDVDLLPDACAAIRTELIGR